MELLTIGEVLDATGGELVKGNRSHLVPNITIDSRKVQTGDCFIAIVGKTLNGHNFGYHAIENGASTVIAHQLFETLSPAENLIRVKNTTRALGDIAAYYRRKFKPTVIAITGSNGKTTTKEMIGHILEAEFKTVKAPNSFNNDIGVPLTVLSIDTNTQVLVVEMEMNQIGGIQRLCEIALPKFGVVTNIGDTHLEFLRDRDGVAREKSELLQAIDGYGTAILNQDDKIVMEIAELFKYHQMLTYGVNTHADIYAANINFLGESGITFLLNNEYQTKLNIPGVYNVYNALAAISVSHCLSIDYKQIIESLASFKLSTMRMEKIQINGVEIINDAFNANPQSMLAALETFADFSSSGRKVLILGDMLELGKKSRELHKYIGNNIPENIDVLITVGKQAKNIARQAKTSSKIGLIQSYDDADQAANKLVDFIQNTDKILIKGSRAMRMELIINKLKEYYAVKTKTN